MTPMYEGDLRLRNKVGVILLSSDAELRIAILNGSKSFDVYDPICCRGVKMDVQWAGCPRTSIFSKEERQLFEANPSRLGL
jgi:hypothetical protein